MEFLIVTSFKSHFIVAFDDSEFLKTNFEVSRIESQVPPPQVQSGVLKSVVILALCGCHSSGVRNQSCVCPM